MYVFLYRFVAGDGSFTFGRVVSDSDNELERWKRNSGSLTKPRRCRRSQSLKNDTAVQQKIEPRRSRRIFERRLVRAGISAEFIKGSQ